MHTLLYDITAAVVVIGIVVGIVWVVPIAIVVGASDKEAPAMAEAVVEPAMSEIAASKAIAWNGGRVEVAGRRRAREAIAEVSTAYTTCGKVGAAKVATARGKAATAKTSATEPAGMTTESTSATTVAAATTTSTTRQSHVRRQRNN